MTIDRIELTPTGIALIAADESRVDLCGSDVWEMLNWLNWHILELWQRHEKAEVLPGPGAAKEEPAS